MKVKLFEDIMPEAEKAINEWLKKNENQIEIFDVKHAVCATPCPVISVSIWYSKK